LLVGFIVLFLFSWSARHFFEMVLKRIEVGFPTSPAMDGALASREKIARRVGSADAVKMRLNASRPSDFSTP